MYFEKHIDHNRWCVNVFPSSQPSDRSVLLASLKCAIIDNDVGEKYLFIRDLDNYTTQRYIHGNDTKPIKGLGQYTLQKTLQWMLEKQLIDLSTRVELYANAGGKFIDGCEEGLIKLYEKYGFHVVGNMGSGNMNPRMYSTVSQINFHIIHQK
jgi:hypothetical protein